LGSWAFGQPGTPIVFLWETRRLSLGKAAQLAGYSKRAFMEILGKHGVAVFQYPPEDLEREANLG
jgi:predicted HTH domain antitoxin